MQKKCTCPGVTRWIEQGPTSTARYRVECVTCKTFIKWGTQAQFDAEPDAVFVSFAASLPPPRPTLDAFISDD